MKKLYVYLFLFNIITCFLIFFYFPAFRDSLLGEDMIIENLTAICFICASLLSIYFLYIGNIKKSRKILTLIIFFGLLGFLDELSFGERMFNLSMPVLGDKKIDGFHDLFKLTYLVIARTLKLLPRSMLAVIAAVVMIVVVIAAIKYRKNLVKIATHIYQSVPWFFIFISIVLLFTSMFLDLNIFYFQYLMFTEELFELNAGLALLFSSYSAFKMVNLQPVTGNNKLPE